MHIFFLLNSALWEGRDCHSVTKYVCVGSVCVAISWLVHTRNLLVLIEFQI